MQQVTGTVSYRQRIALRPGSVVEVSLLDTSRADAPAATIAQTTIENPGSPPIPFTLDYDPGKIDERMSYSVRATIRSGDKMMFTTDTNYAVLTRGAGNTADLMLVAVNMPDTKPDAPLANTYWKLISIGDNAYTHANANREPHLQFRYDGNEVRGFTSCNNFSGEFSASDGNLELGVLATNQRACIEGMEIEMQYLEALGRVDRYAIKGDTMQLLQGDEPLLGFEAVYF